MKPTPLLLLVLCFFLLTNCQKEPEATGLTGGNTSCRPVKGWSYFTTGALSDSFRYEYTNDRLTKIYQNDDEVITYDYSGDNMIKTSFFEIGKSTPYRYQSFYYNATGSVQSLVMAYESFFGPVTDSSVFSYNGSKMASIQIYTKSSLTAATFVRETEYEFTYSGNNITKVVTKFFTDGVLDRTETTLLSFDRVPNYFHKQSSRFLQTDPSFLASDFLYYAFVLSENNVINMADTDTPSDTTEISYLADGKNNLIEMKIDGITALRYAYDCR